MTPGFPELLCGEERVRFQKLWNMFEKGGIEDRRPIPISQTHRENSFGIRTYR